jgi:hypothetical protein
VRADKGQFFLQLAITCHGAGESVSHRLGILDEVMAYEADQAAAYALRLKAPDPLTILARAYGGGSKDKNAS